MKQLLLCLSLLFAAVLPFSSQAQSIPGDIAFVGYNADGDDGFAFVTLVDIAPNTIIHFSDGNWNEMSGTIAGEGVVTFTSGMATIAAGTVISISAINLTPLVLPIGAGTAVESDNGFNLGAGNDVLWAFLGAVGSNQATPTTFLAGIAANEFATGGGLAGTGLTLGTTAIQFNGAGFNGASNPQNDDVLIYAGPTCGQTTLAAYRSIVNDTRYWVSDEGQGNEAINLNYPDFPLDVSGNLSTDVPSGAAATGAIILTEIMRSPAGTDDEWIEIYNRSGSAIDLAGWTISDGRNTHSISGALVVPVAGYAVLNLRNSNGICSGMADYVAMLGESWWFGADGGVRITDVCGLIIDEVDYADGTGDWNPANPGYSLSLDDPAAQTHTTNDDPANWCNSTVTICGAGFATPGVENDGCCAATTYYAVKTTGDWTDGDLWNSAPDGSGCFREDLSQITDVFAKGYYRNTNYVIPAGSTVTVNVSFHACRNLEIEAGGQLLAGITAARYLVVDGTITVDGTWGNGAANDGLAIEVAGADVVLQGNGTADVNRVRSAAIANSAAFTFAMNANIRANIASGIYCFRNNRTLDVTVNNGVRVVLTRSGLSIDGLTGSGDVEQSGTFTIDGTLSAANDLYLLTDNTVADISYVVNGTLEIGGRINGASTAGGVAVANLTLGAGGQLRLAGAGQPWQNMSLGDRNQVSLAAGSTIAYTSTAAQTIFPDLTYANLAIETPAGSLSAATAVAGELSIATAGRLALGDNHLTVDGEVKGSGSGFVVTDGSGQLRVGLDEGGAKMLPIGPTSTDYRPLAVTREAAMAPPLLPSAPSFFGVAVSGMASVTGSPPDNLVDKTWTVVLISGSGAGFFITPSWTVGDEQSSFTSGSCYVSWRENAGSWTGDTPAAAAAGGGFLSRTRGPVTLTAGVINEFIPASNGALPVTLLNFSAQAADRSVLLSWTTSGEIDNDYFAIERSPDGRDFQPIGRVAGVGQSAVVTKYAFTDERPLSGRSYYRLRQVDFDGTAEYFGPVAVDFAGSGKAPLFVYPNPVAADFVTLEGSLDKGSELHLLDATGRVLRAWSPAERELRRELPLAGLPAGVYLLRLTEGERVRTVRLVRE